MSHRVQHQRDQGYYIGFLGSIAIALAFLMLMYALTFPIDSKDSFVYMSLLGVVVLAAGFAMVGFQIQPLDFKRLTMTIMWSGVSFCLIYLVNAWVPVRITIAAPYGETMFSVLAGVAEELFFRVWLCTFIYKFSHSMILSAGVSGGIWALYHINRYGGNMNLLFMIALVGFIQGLIMLYSRMADGPIFGHMLVNYLATT